MGKLTGNEGQRFSKQDRNDAVQNAANAHGHESDYTKHVIFGNDFLQDLIDQDGSVAVKFEIVLGKNGRKTLIPIALDSNGNELEDDEDDKKKGAGKPVKTYDDPPHCPPQC